MIAVYLAFAALLATWALMRKRDWCALTIWMGLAASIPLVVAAPASPMPFAAAIDAITCIAMAAIWTVHNSMRAWSIGFIGFAKTATAGVAHFTDPANTQWVWFIAVNTAFLAQVVIAGGWADGLGIRIDRVFARVAPVRHGLLRDGAR